VLDLTARFFLDIPTAILQKETCNQTNHLANKGTKNVDNLPRPRPWVFGLTRYR
jgi:hypothetical protein